MCGIVGIIDLHAKRNIDPDLLVGMRDCLEHRGPDEAGVFFTEGVALGHRRLSIIDLASGQQPLSNEAQTVTISFNGEIYNYKDLTIQLRKRGHKFHTRSDTEVILRAWEEWGENCVDYLRGMFVFAIYDQIKETLFLARDRLGIKPLVYSETNDGYLIFASEPKALLMHPAVSRKIKLTSVENYFALGYVPEPDTIFANIKKLEAGHRLLVKQGRVQQTNRYWDVPFKSHAHADFDETQQELIERLKEAIDIRLVSEVPLGAFLSGGVDSSAVVALMSELQDDPVQTCSIGMSTSSFDESNYAKQVSSLFHTDHHHKLVGDDDYSLVDKLAAIYDEPFADSSALPTYRVCELARNQVTVALSGDGADELMSGYRRHRWHMKEEMIRRNIPLSIRRFSFGPLAALYPKADWAPQVLRAKSTLQSLSMDAVSAYFNTMSIIPNQQRSKLYSEQFRKSLAGYSALEVFKRHAANAPSSDPLSLIQYIDIKTYLIDDILTKVDKASMAHSLEVRVPFLDHKLVEWISGVGSEYKLRNGEGKSLLKRSLATRLPSNILFRNKMGFSVPLCEWTRGPLRDVVSESLLGERLLSTGLFNQEQLKKIVNEHNSLIKNHSTQIWSLIMFDAFLKLGDCEFA